MVGRICCDSEGRLNERSVLLEGSVELSNGMRTKLDLSKLDSFKLFPGQVSIALYKVVRVWHAVMHPSPLRTLTKMPAAVVPAAFASCIHFGLL